MASISDGLVCVAGKTSVALAAGHFMHERAQFAQVRASALLHSARQALNVISLGLTAVQGAYFCARLPSGSSTSAGGDSGSACVKL
jgi:hypothetical protein